MKKILIVSILVFLYGCESTQPQNIEKINVDNTNIDDRLGGTPLFLAINEKDKITANSYISSKQYIHQSRSDGITPLMLAILKNMQTVSLNLILQGVDINSLTTSKKYGSSIGMSALMFAAEAGNAPLTQMLIEHKADIYLQDENGMSALMYAVISKDLKTVRILGDAGAMNYHFQNKKGHTASTIAYLMGLNDIFQYLKQKKSDALTKQFLH